MENELQLCHDFQTKFQKQGIISQPDACKRIDHLWKSHVYKCISKMKADRSMRKELGDFLLQEVGFFQSLLSALEIYPHTAVEEIVDMNNSTLSGGSYSPSLLTMPSQYHQKGKKKKIDLELVAKIHIYLGDLFRYKMNYQNALLFYAKSSLYFSNALAFNQMAVIYHSLKDLVLATHFYIRAALHTTKFPAASDNLKKLLDSMAKISDPTVISYECNLADIAQTAISYTDNRNLVRFLNVVGLKVLFPSEDQASTNELFMSLKRNLTQRKDSQLLLSALLCLNRILENSSVFNHGQREEMGRIVANIIQERIDDDKVLKSPGREVRIGKKWNSDIKDLQLFGDTSKLHFTIGSFEMEDTIADLLLSINKRYFSSPAIFAASSAAELIIPNSTQTPAITLTENTEEDNEEEEEDDIVLFKGRSTQSSASKASSPLVASLATPRLDMSALRRPLAVKEEKGLKISPVGHEREFASGKSAIQGNNIDTCGKRNSMGSNTNKPPGSSGYLLFPPPSANSNILLGNLNGGDNDPFVQLGNQISFQNPFQLTGSSEIKKK